MQSQFVEFLKCNYSIIPDKTTPKIGHVLYIYSDQQQDFGKATNRIFSILQQSYQNQFNAVKNVKNAIRRSMQRMYINFKKLNNDTTRQSFAGQDFRLPNATFISTELHSKADQEVSFDCSESCTVSRLIDS